MATKERQKIATELKAENTFTLGLLVSIVSESEFNAYAKLLELARSVDAQKKVRLILNNRIDKYANK